MVAVPSYKHISHKYHILVSTGLSHMHFFKLQIAIIELPKELLFN